MAPTYMQIKIRTASPAASLKVRVVSSASPSVAVKPGSMPTAIPSSVDHATAKIVWKVNRSAIAETK